MNRATPHKRRDATWLVALGAALWGTDALLHKAVDTPDPVEEAVLVPA